MPSSREPREELRVGWVDGRLLATADVCDEADHGAWLRSRHVLGVHRTWGVVWGLEARLESRLARVTVAPGLAYDACGAELGFAGAVEARAPEPTVDGTLLCLRDAGGGCAELVWRAPGELRPGADVPLAVLRLDDVAWLDRHACRRAASQRRPLMHSGALAAVPVGEFDAIADGGVLTAEIEFEGAGESFASPPAVFVSVRALPVEPGAQPPAVLASVEQASAEGFVLAVVIAGGDVGALEPLDINWLAVGERIDTEDTA